MVMAEKKRPLPPEALKALAEFLEMQRSGSFVLDVKDGRVLGWRGMESGRVSAGRYGLR